MGDLNINTLTQTNSNNTANHLMDFCDLFALSNLVNVKTCTKSVCGTSLDIMLTKKPRSFYNTGAVTTGLSDCHKLTLSCLRAHFKRLPPKKIIYRDYKMFDEVKFPGDSSNQQNDTNNVKKIISEYKNHPSAVKVKETYKHFGNFYLPKASPKDINKIIKSLNSKKATGPNKIPPKLVKLAANIIDCHICNILNQSISSSKFPEQSRIANVRPIYEKDKREEIKNYRPVSVLSSFSRNYEKIIQESLTPFVDKFLSEFIHETASVMFYLLQNCMLMALVKTTLRFSTPI